MLKHIGMSTAMIIAALCGLLTAYILAEEFFFQDIPSDKADKPGIFKQVSQQTCGSAESLWSCARVSESKWATIHNVPMAVYGVFYYTALSLLALVFMFSHPDLRYETLVFFFWTAVAGLAADMYLLYISLVQIRAICPLCMVTYGVGFLCVCISGWGLFRKKINPLRMIRCLKNIYMNGGIKNIGGGVIITVLILLISYGAAYGTSRYLSKTKTTYYLKKKQVVLEKIINKFDEEERQNLDLPETMVIGSPEAPVTITEFSDFLCPFCGKAAALIDEILLDNPTKVRLVFHNYPLDKACNTYMKNDVHHGSCLLAKGAVCASDQGFFEDYQRMVFSARLRIGTPAILEKIAFYINLNEPQFKACLEDPETDKLIQEQIKDAKRFGINSTPSIFINGKRYHGKLIKEMLQMIIDLEYDRATGK